MSAGKHTAGPWYADKLDDRNAFNIFPSGATLALLQVSGPVHDGAHPYAIAATANAALIAAAPELLDELQKAHRLLQLALKHMGGERQSLFAAESEREGLGTEGATRHHERAAVLAKATGAEADPQPIPVGEAQDSDFGAFQAAAS